MGVYVTPFTSPVSVSGSGLKSSKSSTGEASE